MLEQAIVDAAALREAALKNAEQSVIEKYAPEIKAAVDSILEEETKESLTEQEAAAMATSAPASTPIEAPFAVGDQNPSGEVEMNIEFEFNPADFDLDLGDLKQQAAEEETTGEEDVETTDELMDDLGLDEEGEETEAETDEEELALQEILNMLAEAEEEVLEEELVVDMGQTKTGTFETNKGELQYQEEMELAKRESTKYKEENEELEKKLADLKESIESYKTKNKDLYSAVKQLKNKLEETMLSNAKLIYSNRILSDASLNERQKDKIVEAIAKAKTKDEAKSLCEALKTTVGTTKDDGPKSLSESVNRKSNLSNILPRRKKEINESKDHSFTDRMRKLAGIS